LAAAAERISDSDPTIAIHRYTPSALLDQFPQRCGQLLCLRFGALVAEVLIHARVMRPARLALVLVEVGDEQHLPALFDRVDHALDQPVFFKRRAGQRFADHVLAEQGIELNSIRIGERNDRTGALRRREIQDGESPEEALIRELREELGINVKQACLAPTPSPAMNTKSSSC
jgi:hypothetical protein